MISPSDIVVVGASLAGLNAARTALETNPGARVTLIGAETHLPYDRPPLSKEILGGGHTDPVRLTGAEEIAADERCRLRLGVTATGLDPQARRVLTDSGEMSYDALVIATGARVRRLPIATPAGVHYLRTWEDALAVETGIAAGGRLVVIGAGFIGSEVAASAAKRGLLVTILEAQPVPLERAVGATAGSALAGVHRRHGVEVRLGAQVQGFVGKGRVTGVVLGDGSVADADLVVGIGAVPDTDWLDGSGIALDNGVVCDATLRTSLDGVYAAGDLARWTNPAFDRRMRLEHWTSAQDQGRIAGRNAADPANATVCEHIPYFWSDWYDSRIQFVGIPLGEPELLENDWDSEAFTAAYRDADRLTGVLTLNRRADIMKYRALLANRGTIADAHRIAEARAAVRAAKNR